MYLTEEEKEQLARENIKLVHYISHKYHNKKYEYEDVFSAAQFGFASALKRFDPKRGVKFQTYAAQAMINLILQHYRDMETRIKPAVSLDKRFYSKEGDSFALIDTLPAPEEDVNWKEINEAAKRAAEKMSDREKEVLHLYFSGMAQTVIGEHLGVSQMQVSRILKRAFQKIRDEYWR